MEGLLEKSKLHLETGESLDSNYLSKAQEIEIEMWNQTVSSAQPSAGSEIPSSGKYHMRGQDYYSLHASISGPQSPDLVLQVSCKPGPCHDVTTQGQVQQALYDSGDSSRFMEQEDSFTPSTRSVQDSSHGLEKAHCVPRREIRRQFEPSAALRNVHGHATMDEVRNIMDVHDANSWYGTNWTGSTTTFAPWPENASPISVPYPEDVNATFPSFTDDVWEPTSLTGIDILDQTSEDPSSEPSNKIADDIHNDLSSVLYNPALAHNDMSPTHLAKPNSDQTESSGAHSVPSYHSGIDASGIGSKEVSLQYGAKDLPEKEISKLERSQNPESSGKSDESIRRSYSPTSSSIDSTRRSSSKADSNNVRQGPLYQASPQEDGLYHCPFEGDGSCRHEPTKLKCNYDKNVDSHIRPHACHVSGCEDLKFSSAACKLRHEREAHGSHGHGVKPYVCLYHDCERSKAGRGFPRSWNRNDHMKRMHGHDSTTANAFKSSVPQELFVKSLIVEPPKKRSNSDQLQAMPEKKSKANDWESVPEPSHPEPKEQSLHDHMYELDRQWQQQHSRLKALVAELQGPHDQQKIRQLHNDVSNLGNISGKIAQIQFRLKRSKSIGQT